MESLLAALTDPSDALTSFQQGLQNGDIQLERGELDPELFVHLDHPNEMTRFTYVRLQGRTVTAFVMLVAVEPIEGTPCLQIGYAVPKAYRICASSRTTS